MAEAERLLDDALDEGADPAEVHYRLGLAQLGRGAVEEAAESFEVAVHARPDHAEAWSRLSAMQIQQGRFEDAHRSAQTAIGLGIEASNNLGLACRGLGRLEEALVAFRAAIERDAAHPEARANLGIVLRDLGRVDEAIAQFDEVLRYDPLDHDVLWYRSVARLASGDFSGGWQDYEKRWLQRDAIRRPGGIPACTGPLGNRSILVTTEQGIGDQIMFASCLPEVIGMAAHCTIESWPKLVSLFARSFPSTTVVAFPAEGVRADCQVPVGSLPLALNRGIAGFPPHEGYLRADPARVTHWRSELEHLGPGVKIGISWRGGTPRTGLPLRSISMAQLAPLWGLAGCQFVSVQYGDTAQDVATARREFGARLHAFDLPAEDLDETAALLCALDLTISVTTAVVHLAGALGREAWVMVPAAPEWRYLMSGERMPWYPGVLLFRQRSLLDWAPVVNAIAARLAGRLGLPAPRAQ